MKLNPFEILYSYTPDPMDWDISHEETIMAILLGDHDEKSIKAIAKQCGWSSEKVKTIKKEAAAVKEARAQWESFNKISP